MMGILGWALGCVGFGVAFYQYHQRQARDWDFIEALDPLTRRPWQGCPCCKLAHPDYAHYCRQCGWYLNPNAELWR